MLKISGGCKVFHKTLAAVETPPPNKNSQLLCVCVCLIRKPQNSVDFCSPAMFNCQQETNHWRGPRLLRVAASDVACCNERLDHADAGILNGEGGVGLVRNDLEEIRLGLRA